MRANRLFPLSLLVLTLGLLGGCGGGGSSDTTEGGAAQEESPSAAAPAESGAAEEPAGEGSEEAPANAPAPSGEPVRAEKVEIVNFAYEPDPVRIQVGGKVTWLNQDSAPHTATADDGSFDTGTLQEGKLKAETFKEPGTFEYHCTIHPSMHGTIEVVEAG
jgi:plastocyanin